MPSPTFSRKRKLSNFYCDQEDEIRNTKKGKRDEESESTVKNYSNTYEVPNSPAATLVESIIRDSTTRQSLLELSSQNILPDLSCLSFCTPLKEKNKNKAATSNETFTPSPRQHLKNRIINVESPSALLRMRLRAQRDPCFNDDELPLTCEEPKVSKHELLKGMNFYAEVRFGNDNNSYGIKAVLRSMGATVHDKLTKNVTHVIFREGLLSTYNKAKKINAHLLSVLWLDAVRNSGRLVPESAYPALGLQNYESPETAKRFKRIKSLQPDYDNKKKTNRGKIRETLGIEKIIEPFDNCSESSSTKTTSTRKSIDWLSALDSVVEKLNLQNSSPKYPEDYVPLADRLRENYLKQRNTLDQENMIKTPTNNTNNSTHITRKRNVVVRQTMSPTAKIDFVPFSQDVKSKNYQLQKQYKKCSQDTPGLSKILENTNDECRYPDLRPVVQALKNDVNDSLRRALFKKIDGNENVLSNSNNVMKNISSSKTIEDSSLTFSSSVNDRKKISPGNKIKERTRKSIRLSSKQTNCMANKNESILKEDNVSKNTIDNYFTKTLNKNEKHISGRKSSCLSTIGLPNNDDSKKMRRKTTNESPLKNNTQMSEVFGTQKSVKKRKLFNNLDNVSELETSISENIGPVPFPYRKKEENKTKSDKSTKKTNRNKYTKTISSNNENNSNRNSLIHFAPQKTKKYKKMTAENKETPSIVGTRLHTDESLLLYQVVEKLGDFIVENNVTSKTTHLVCGESKRTVNLLLALTRGCWIVKFEWVLRSLEIGKWLDETEFELIDFSKAVKKCRIERITFGSPYHMNIFSECGLMYVCNDTNPKASKLKELIKLAGGTLVKTARCASIIIGNSPVRYKNVMHLSESWVLDSIANKQKKWMKKYQLMGPSSQLEDISH